ncbi:undecaprenyl-diphosphate phosphatase [Patescibacteria group bacterium]|nr:undecaprenyl-diphosphate phosphatase [Patescibacteria group bacterium]
MLESIILGIVQGIFEWLPISSQGNLVLIMVGFFNIGIETAVKYSIFLHFGTLLAVLVYFKKDIINILKNLKEFKFKFENKQNGLISFLIVSTVITFIIGFPLYKLISNFSFRGEFFLGLIGIGLIITGLLQKFAHKSKIKEKRLLTLKDSVLLGVVQGLAVIPGISRSGITISTFLFKKYSAKQGLYLSFLMSIPVLLGGIVLPILDGFPNLPFINLFLGLIFSFIFGLITIKILMQLAQKIRFWLFAIIIGILAFVPLVFSLWI